MPAEFITLLSLAGALFVLAACDTVEGMGQDVKATGEAIEKAVDKNKTH